MTRGRCAKLVGECAMLFASALFCSGTSDSASVTLNPRPVQAQHSTDVQGVRVAPLERDAIAQEMRTMLRSLSLILQGLAVGDLEMAEKAARASGKATMLQSEIARNFPSHFVELDTKVHTRFDQFADAPKTGGRSDLMKRLAALTAYCVACHEMYRLEIPR